MEQMNLIISTVLIILGTFNIATLASPMKHHDYPEFSSERKANKDFSRLSIQREVHVPEELVSRGEQSGEALAPPAPTPTPAMIPNLSGTWYNQLGSNMTIVQENDGSLTGYYINQAPGSQDYTIEQLIGSYGNGIPATFGFVVNYVEGKFTTAWSGQYHQESKDGEVLLTTWIMTANQQDPEEYWKAVNIGQDRFTRMPWVENYK